MEIEEVKEKLEGRELFPAAVQRAKEMVNSK